MDRSCQYSRIFCTSCGKENAVDAAFCNGCGTRIPEGTIRGARPVPMARVPDPLIDRTIEGRFKILKLLGEGGMGRVYLAEQTSMGRPVALKVLNPSVTWDDRMKERFRNEAALASRLNHPNTVTIYDFGVTEEGLMFIAMELVSGKSLRDELDAVGTMRWPRAVGIARQICGSLQDAHDHAIIHRDLKPENIMLLTRQSESDIAKVLDFGVAKILDLSDRKMNHSLTSPNEIFGTPEYMSPEQARGEDLTPSTDIYSLGIILYRMLTGRLPFEARTPVAVLAKHLAECPPPLRSTSEVRDIPAMLETLVMESLAKKSDERPPSMDALRVRLSELDVAEDFIGRDLQVPVATPKPMASPQPALVVAARLSRHTPNVPAQEAQGTVEAPPTHPRVPSVEAPEDKVSIREQTLNRLLERIKKHRDFPAVSRHVSELNTKVGLETTTASELANVILRDTSLTARLIKLANSPLYGASLGRITMISRAVVLMGFDAVRDAALGLLLFDHMVSDDPKHVSALRDAAVGALMSGIVARQNAWRIEGLNKEEAFVCAMFHNLGRSAALFYFPSEMNEIEARVKKGLSEAAAVHQVLGIPYHEIGQALAEQWHFPERLRLTMTPLPESRLLKAKSVQEKLRHLAGFASELSEVAGTPGRGKRKHAFKRIAQRFSENFKVSEDEIALVVSDALDQLEEYTRLMGLHPGESPLVKQLMSAAGRTSASAEKEEMIAAPALARASLLGEPTLQPADRSDRAQEQILMEGLAEVEASVKGKFDLNAVMLMVLETMYRGLGLSRVIFCLHDVRTKTLRARSGFGEGVDGLIPGFNFPARGGSDLFSHALATGEDVAVMNSQEARYTGKIPVWYKNLVGAPMFLLYPIRIKSFPAALFYGDMATPGVTIDESLLEQMKSLRDQATRAIHLDGESARRRG